MHVGFVVFVVVFVVFVRSAMVFPFFFGCLCGDQQKVDQRFWRVACHGVLCFCCSFLAGGCALVVFVYFVGLP